MAALAPRFRLNELGVKVVATPEEAGVLLVTGGGNIKIDSDLKKVYERIQPPKIVVAIGSCAISWEAFEGGYSIVGPADETIPVNAYVCGCPPPPQAIIDALAKVLGIEIEEREDFWRAAEGYRGAPELDQEKCTACGACEQRCPTRAITVRKENGSSTVTYLLGKCSYCGTCEKVCPDDAVRLTQEYRLTFKDRRTAVVTADIELSPCPQCGSLFVSSRQIKRALTTIEEKAEEYSGLRRDIWRAMELCLECRDKIKNIREAKKLLTRLDIKALETR